MLEDNSLGGFGSPSSFAKSFPLDVAGFTMKLRFLLLFV
jgi:hypothetical protein